MSGGREASPGSLLNTHLAQGTVPGFSDLPVPLYLCRQFFLALVRLVAARHGPSIAERSSNSQLATRVARHPRSPPTPTAVQWDRQHLDHRSLRI